MTLKTTQCKQNLSSYSFYYYSKRSETVYSFSTNFLIGNSPFAIYLSPYTMRSDSVFHNGLLISFNHHFRAKQPTTDPYTRLPLFGRLI